MEEIISASLLMNILDELPIQKGIDRDFLKEYCQVIGIKSKNVNRNILNRLQKFYESYGYLPEDLDVFSRFQIESCTCGNIPITDIPEASKIMSHIIKNDNRIPPCSFVLVNLEFYKQERRIATNDELTNYIQNIYNMQSDPERFHQENKLRIPTPNLHLLKAEKCCKTDNCGLCMDEITEGNECYKLPCGHIYHSNEEECISSTVKTWLSENKTCPVCKTEVVLN